MDLKIEIRLNDKSWFEIELKDDLGERLVMQLGEVLSNLIQRFRDGELTPEQIIRFQIDRSIGGAAGTAIHTYVREKR